LPEFVAAEISSAKKPETNHSRGNDMSKDGETGLGPINPAAIPRRKMYTGATMPAIGLGTFGSDRVGPKEVAAAVKGAAAIGYRHFDCASVYGNEEAVGEADVIASCQKSLADLRLDYLDLFLVHWPFPNFHPPGCDVTSRSPNAKPYIHGNYMKTWRAMETLVERKLVRHIGTSNMTIPKLKLVLRDARIKPAVNEMELHPHFQQPELFQFVVENGVQPIGYCPLGSPGRPERDRTPEDTAPIEDPVIIRIAQRHGVHPASVCVKWAVQRGQTPIPFSVSPRNYTANLQAASGDWLSDEEMRAIAALDRNCRLIKGQVFLWKDGQSWEDLWDIGGEITPP
jgi:diketogulonate reductase-like aldo/keto reductase